MRQVCLCPTEDVVNYYLIRDTLVVYVATSTMCNPKDQRRRQDNKCLLTAQLPSPSLTDPDLAALACFP